MKKFSAVVVCLYCVPFSIYLLLRLLIGDGIWWMAFLNNFLFWGFVPLALLLPLALLSRMPRLTALVLVLLGVGVIRYTPRFLPQNIAGAQAGEMLRVIQFNMWGANQQQDQVIVWLSQSDADVVTLQETPPAFRRERLSELRQAFPYQFTNAQGDEWGQVILSRYPFVETGVSVLGQPRVVIDVNGRHMTVYDVHLEMPNRETPHIRLPIDISWLNAVVKYDATLRDQQLEMLLSQLSGEAGDLIVAGDFNISDDAVTYYRIAEVLRDSYSEVGYGLGRTWGARTSEEGLPEWLPPLVRIDYVWYRGAMQAIRAEVGVEMGSDHLPVLVTLHWQ